MRCFYYDVSDESEIPSDAAVEHDESAATARLSALSHEPGSFFGVYTASGLVVQFLWEEDDDGEGRLQIDVPLVDRRGSLQKLSTLDAALALLRSLYADPALNPADDPELIFVSWE